MKIISHRGFWLKPSEQNSLAAFIRALDYGFGIEFDARDYNKKIVVSHDTPNSRNKKLKDILRIPCKHNNFEKIIYAINIKSDGIEKQITEIIKDSGIKKNSFVFDMSIPSMHIFKNLGQKTNFATRHSDLESNPILYNTASWVWMDELTKHWIDNISIRRHIENKKLVCIVSPELHKHPYLGTWQEYSLLPRHILNNLFICTDFPLRADKFFNRN